MKIIIGKRLKHKRDSEIIEIRYVSNVHIIFGIVSGARMGQEISTDSYQINRWYTEVENMTYELSYSKQIKIPFIGIPITEIDPLLEAVKLVNKYAGSTFVGIREVG